MNDKVKNKIERASIKALCVLMMAILIQTLNLSELLGLPFNAKASETMNPYHSEYGLDQFSQPLRDAYDRLHSMAEKTVQSDYTTRNMYAGGYIFASASVPYALTDDEIALVYNTFMYNHPIYYWVDSYAYMSGSGVTTIILISREDAGIKYKTLYNEMVTIVKDKLTAVADVKDDYRKARILHDTLANEVTYIYEPDGITPSRKPSAHKADGALLRKQAVCEGYATAYSLLLNAAGIENCFVFGYYGDTLTELTGHVWNGVKINNEWYYMDVTWDDSVDNTIGYTWFLYGQNYHDSADKTIGQPETIIYALPNFADDYCTGEVGDIAEYKLTYDKTNSNYGKINVYNQGILLNINQGMNVEAGSKITLKMLDATMKATFIVNGSEITGDTFTVTANSVIAANLEPVNVTGVVSPISVNTIEIPHEFDDDKYYTPYGIKNYNGNPFRGYLTYHTEVGDCQLEFYWRSDNFVEGPGKKEYDVYTELYNPPSYLNIPDQYKKLTYHIIEAGKAIQVILKDPSDSAKIVMKDEAGKEYPNGSFIEIGSLVTLSVEEEGTARSATFSYSDAPDSVTSTQIEGNSFIVTESSIVFIATLQTTDVTAVGDIVQEYNVVNGTVAMPSQLMLQSEVEITTTVGTTKVPLVWDISNYDATNATAHDVTVTATPQLPTYITDSNEIISAKSVILHVSQGHLISSIDTVIADTLNVSAGTPKNPVSLGLPMSVSCSSEETGSSFTAKVNWEVQGEGNPYVMSGKVMRAGYLCETPIMVTVNETEGFTAIPSAKLEFARGEDKQPITQLNQSGADTFMVTFSIQPIAEHSNRYATVVIPKGMTVIEYAKADELEKIDSIVTSVREEDGSTLLKMGISNELSDSSTISYDILVSLNFNAISSANTSNDFGMLYGMGEEIPFAIQYEAQENGIDRSMYLDPQNTIKVRDDYPFTADGSQIIEVLPIQIADLYETMFTNYDIGFEFFNAKDMPYFTSVQAVIPLPSVMSTLELVLYNSNKLSCVDNPAGYKELILTVNHSHGIYATEAKECLNSLVMSATTNMPSVEPGRNYKATAPIVYIFTDNFGHQYRFDTGIYNEVITKPQLSVDTAKMGQPSAATPLIEHRSSQIDIPVITNVNDFGDLSVRSAEQAKIEITVPDSVTPNQIKYNVKPNLVKVYYSDGTSQEITTPGDYNNDITASPENTSISKIELSYAKIGPTNGLRVNMMVTANSKRQDGSTIIFGQKYEVKNGVVVTDCDTDQIDVNFSYVGVRSHSESQKLPIYFQLAQKNNHINMVIDDVTDIYPEKSTIDVGGNWKITNSGDGTAAGDPIHHVTAELKVTKSNKEIIHITGLSAKSGAITQTNQNYTITVHYTDGTSENLTIASTGAFNYTVPEGKVIDNVLLNAEEIKNNESAKIYVQYRVDATTFVETYGYPPQPGRYYSEGIITNALQCTVNADEIDLEKDILFAYGKLQMHTGAEYKSSVYTKGVSNTQHTLTNELVQTNVVTTKVDFETKHFNYDYPEELVLDCAKVKVSLKLHDYLDYQKKSAVLDNGFGTTYQVTSESLEGNTLNLTFEDVDLKTRDGSYGKAGCTFSVSIDTKPYFNAVSGDNYKNISIANKSCVLELDTIQQAQANYPFIKLDLSTVIPLQTGNKSGKLSILASSEEKLDNYGGTTERSTVDYGPYAITENQDFTYNIFVFSQSNQCIKDMTQYVVIPKQGTVIASKSEEDKTSELDTVLKGITVQAPKADSNYSVFYTMDKVKEDNTETYHPYDEATLSAEDRKSITKIKITANKGYWGDLITFTLSHPNGGNKAEGYVSAYLSSQYTYTGVLTNTPTKGQTTAVEYLLDNRSEYGWKVTPQALQYTSEAENAQTEQSLIINVINTGKQSISNISVSGCESWLNILTPQKTATGFAINAVVKTGLPVGTKQGTLQITADGIAALSPLTVNVSKTITQKVVTPSGSATPTTPSGPATPTTPSEPATPTTPSGPATPTTPSGPATPATPSGSVTPTQPGTTADAKTATQIANVSTAAETAQTEDSKVATKGIWGFLVAPKTGEATGRTVLLTLASIAVILTILLCFLTYRKNRAGDDEE